MNRLAPIKAASTYNCPGLNSSGSSRTNITEQAAATSRHHADHNRGENGKLRVERMLDANYRIATDAQCVREKKDWLEAVHMIAKQSRANAAENNNKEITPVTHRERWSPLDENAIADQTTAHSTYQRQDEQAHHIIMPANGQQGASHRVEASRTQVDVKR